MIKVTIMSGKRFMQVGMFCVISISSCLLSTVNLSGQSTDDVDAAIAGVQINTAPVKLDGNILFYVRGISSFPAELRAETISKRIKKAAIELSPGSDSIKIVEDEERSEVFAGKEFIMNIYDVDAKSENIDRESLTHIFQIKIYSAIQLFRHEHSRPVLIRKIVYALGVAVLLIIVLYVILWLIRRLDSFLQVRIRSGVDSLEKKSYMLIKSVHLLKAIHGFFIFLKIFLIIALITGFVEYTLHLLPWTKNIAQSVLDLFLQPLKTMGNGILGFIPSLAFLTVIFFVTRYFLKLIRLLFTGIDQGAIELQNFPPVWAMPTFRIVRMLVIAFAVVIAYPYIPGSESGAFKGVTVFLGVLFSLGSSSFIGNIIAGYSMTYRMAFKKGDLIQVDDNIGFVEEQKILVTRLRSHKNEEIVIPNSQLQNSKIINFSAREKDKRLILHTSVGIGYETPWRQVDAMLHLAAERTKGLLKDPPPFVLKKSLGDFAVNYEINVYCDDVANILTHYTNLHQNILDVFNENNVQIMTPAYVMDPEAPKVVPVDQWDTPLSNGNIKD
jgi:small-conductance mechanosensitive channel